MSVSTQDGGDEKSDPDICYFNMSPPLDSGDVLYIYYSELLHLSAAGNFNAPLSNYLIIQVLTYTFLLEASSELPILPKVRIEGRICFSP